MSSIGRAITAEVIMCPGRHADDRYPVLDIVVEGFSSPYRLILQLPCVGFRALLDSKIDPLDVLKALEAKINAK